MSKFFSILVAKSSISILSLFLCFAIIHASSKIVSIKLSPISVKNFSTFISKVSVDVKLLHKSEIELFFKTLVL